ncbi:hypothetical protein U2388_15060, partial [Listeria monocytogenes]|uniref:hypothetical protein n=1 Tax=Listeria monocytogenes TaxID=1639 RepID=UPI002FDBACD6
MDWTTVGLYLANEKLWKAPELCYAKATEMDEESFLAPRELGMHYLRMARGPLALSASRLPGHPQREHLE